MAIAGLMYLAVIILIILGIYVWNDPGDDDGMNH